MLPGSTILESVVGVASALLLAGHLLHKYFLPKRSARASLAAATAAAVLGLGVGPFAAGVLRHPIVHERSCEYCRGGVGPLATGFAAALVVPAAGGILALLGIAVGRRLGERRADHLWRGARVLGWTLLGLTAVTSIASVVASCRKARVSWPTYVHGLPIVASISHPPSASGSGSADWRAIEGDRHERWTAGSGGLHLAGKRGDEIVRVSTAPFLANEDLHYGEPLLLYNRPLGIVARRDGTRGILYVAVEGHRAVRSAEFSGPLAFRDSTRIAVHATDLASTLAPPRSWIVLGIGSMPFALLLLLRPPPIAALLARRRRWREIVHTGDSPSMLIDGESVALPTTAMPTAGVMTVVLADPVRTTGYRGPHVETMVVAPCTMAALERAIDTALAARAVWAVAVLVTTASPLFALAALGFLRP